MPVQRTRQIVLTEGVCAGLVLGVCVIVLAFLGLAPSMAWIPEVPLLAIAFAVPVAGYAVTGYRVRKRAGSVLAAALAASVAGALSGGVGGVMYVVFGKPVVNIAVGLLVGAVGGAMVGAATAQLSQVLTRRAR